MQPGGRKREREGNESKQEFRVINGLWLGAEEERLVRG
jgi:hypothetical protein